MATAAVKNTGVEVTLVLTQAEAQYVQAALCKASPTRLDEDTVYLALSDALLDSNVGLDLGAA